jgi:hypothetical protein
MAGRQQEQLALWAAVPAPLPSTAWACRRPLPATVKAGAVSVRGASAPQDRQDAGRFHSATGRSAEKTPHCGHS